MKSTYTTQDAQRSIKADKIKQVKKSPFSLHSTDSNEEDNNVL